MLKARRNFKSSGNPLIFQIRKLRGKVIYPKSWYRTVHLSFFVLPQTGSHQFLGFIEQLAFTSVANYFIWIQCFRSFDRETYQYMFRKHISLEKHGDCTLLLSNIVHLFTGTHWVFYMYLSEFFFNAVTNFEVYPCIMHYQALAVANIKAWNLIPRLLGL